MGNLLTDTELADLLRLTPRQVVRLANRGELPSVRLPNHELRFDPADVQQWVERYKRPADGGGK